MKIEATIEDIHARFSDWIYGMRENPESSNPEQAVGGDTVDLSPWSMDDIAEVLATVNGENDGADWVGAFKLKDGRFVLWFGGCDYTGWDCRSSAQSVAAASFRDLIQFGMTNEQRDRLEAPMVPAPEIDD